MVTKGGPVLLLCAWTFADDRFENLDRRRSRQETSFWSRCVGCILKNEFCMAD